MAKIVKMNPQIQKEPKFEEFLKNLPKKDRALLEEFNINSNEDMIAFFTASGRIAYDTFLPRQALSRADISPK